MTKPEVVGPVHEYQSLRQELLDSKKYVFERPLLIATLAIAALNAVEKDSVALIPVLLSAFLIFNFWFTVNRLFSAARIVAYIQLQHEEGIVAWKGWETSLRKYRKWVGIKESQSVVDRELDKDAVPDALLYYPAIYGLHIGIACLAALSSLWVVAFRGPDLLSLACCALTLSLVTIFESDTRRYQPSFMRTLIERNRIIWKYALTGKPMPKPPGSGIDGEMSKLKSKPDKDGEPTEPAK